VHPNANIVKFSSASGSRPSSAMGSQSPRAPDAASNGTLPWASPTDRTLAAGPMEIYRVPGSVSFLHSGSLLHAILPRSQCWCVDGVSKFALRVLPDTYYRIELPGDTPEDQEQVETLKLTLQKVLFYERTPCPFARRFVVDMPSEEPVRRRSKRKSLGPAKRWTLDRGYSWRPEDGAEPPRRGSRGSSDGSGSAASEDEEVETSATSGQGNDDSASEAADEVRELRLKTPSRPKALAAARSITAPPQLTLRSTPPSSVRTNLAVEKIVEGINQAELSRRPAEGEQQPSGLRTFQTIPTDMPPSPPDSSAGVDPTDAPSRFMLGDPQQSVGGAEVHPEDVGKFDPDNKVMAYQDSAVVLSSAADIIAPNGSHSTGQLRDEHRDMASMTDGMVEREHVQSTTHDSPVKVQHDPNDLLVVSRQRSAEDPFAAIQARILARRSIGGTTSFHPTSTSSTSSTSSTATAGSAISRRPESKAQHQQAFATALVRKACAVFLGPPAHLVVIMLRIAARFTNGAFGVGSSFVIESPAGSKHVPGSFNLESVDADDFVDEIEADEDDFGVPLRSPVRLAALGGAVGGLQERRGWEVE